MINPKRAISHTKGRITQVILLPFLVVLFGLMTACNHKEVALPGLEEGEEIPGGKLATVSDITLNAFGHAAPGLTSEESDHFALGNSFFRNAWVAAPALAAARDGLGPVFVASSCGACHLHDGRGSAPAGPGELPMGLLFRVSMPGEGPHGEPAPHPEYGDQIQVRSILGVKPEALAKVEWEARNGAFSDGLPYNLRSPKVTFYEFFNGDLAGAMVSPRLAPQIPGLGLLEAVPEGAILEYADESDRNSDSISGKPNYVYNIKTDRTELGRFGWKANQPTIEQQAAGAFNGDMGITTSLFPSQNLTGLAATFYQNLPNGGAPELEDANLQAMTVYLQGLAVPARRNARDAEVLAGKALFQKTGCTACHRPSMQTGTHPVASLVNQKIFPYTDLLLHDMGPALADGRSDFKAFGSEWRTPPLWGIGLVKTVNRDTHFLHDGRARSLEEAVLWHGGEASRAQRAYKTLSQTDRARLIKFVESL